MKDGRGEGELPVPNEVKQRRAVAFGDLLRRLRRRKLPLPDPSPTWTDHHGAEHRTPARSVHRLKARCHLHRALRRFVIARDKSCRYCGCTDDSLVVDHVVSIRNGGHHHPTNLVAACASCNAAKSALVDARLSALV